MVPASHTVINKVADQLVRQWARAINNHGIDGLSPDFAVLQQYGFTELVKTNCSNTAHIEHVVCDIELTELNIVFIFMGEAATE